MDNITVFCPGTVANVSCGFDVLGLCLDTVGDIMKVKKVSREGITITKVTGADLHLDADKNVAGVAAMAFINDVQPSFGFEISIEKKIKAGSGIGSSAASAAGAVYALNHLCGNPLSNTELVKHAMAGEALASGSAHADNVAPCLVGGFTLIRSYTPLDIIKINAPAELFATVIHPHIELKTKDSRSVLKETISLKKGIIQCGNLAGLISGLYTNDYSLIGRSLHDEFVESSRSVLIPNFKALKEAALTAGALGVGISGSGPSVFALSQGEITAKRIGEQFTKVMEQSDISFDVHVSPINPTGIKIIG